MNPIVRRRQLLNVAVLVAATAATLFGLVWLVWILVTTVSNGVAALGPHLFTDSTPPPNAVGGLLNAFYGSAIMIVLAIVVGTPVGVLAGTWLAEFGRTSRIAATIRFVNDILLSAPSIVIGLFVYELVVLQTGHFSGVAGGFALALILVPVVVRTSDEALRLVPNQVREAALALGLPQWKVTTRVIYRAGSTAIITGVLLAVARISGETAPLLFTALNNQFWTWNPRGPIANVPVVIFQFAMSPSDTWHSLAWAGALVVTVFVLSLSIVVRLFFKSKVPR